MTSIHDDDELQSLLKKTISDYDSIIDNLTIEIKNLLNENDQLRKKLKETNTPSILNSKNTPSPQKKQNFNFGSTRDLKG